MRKNKRIRSRWDEGSSSCEFENNSYCNIPKQKRCGDCVRNRNKGKYCRKTYIF